MSNETRESRFTTQSNAPGTRILRMIAVLEMDGDIVFLETDKIEDFSLTVEPESFANVETGFAGRNWRIAYPNRLNLRVRVTGYVLTQMAPVLRNENVTKLVSKIFRSEPLPQEKIKLENKDPEFPTDRETRMGWE